MRIHSCCETNIANIETTKLLTYVKILLAKNLPKAKSELFKKNHPLSSFVLVYIISIQKGNIRYNAKLVFVEIITF